jgi:hypothetical protein
LVLVVDVSFVEALAVDFAEELFSPWSQSAMSWNTDFLADEDPVWAA